MSGNDTVARAEAGLILSAAHRNAVLYVHELEEGEAESIESSRERSQTAKQSWTTLAAMVCGAGCGGGEHQSHRPLRHGRSDSRPAELSSHQHH